MLDPHSPPGHLPLSGGVSERESYHSQVTQQGGGGWGWFPSPLQTGKTTPLWTKGRKISVASRWQCWLPWGGVGGGGSKGFQESLPHPLQPGHCNLEERWCLFPRQSNLKSYGRWREGVVVEISLVTHHSLILLLSHLFIPSPIHPFLHLFNKYL